MEVATSSREIRLAARPRGEPVESDFQLVETEVADPGPGQVLVRNLAMSVDPYMRGRMDDVPSYAPPWQLGQAADGGAVGEVVASQAPELPVGSRVLHSCGWRDYALLPARQAERVEPVPGLSSTAYLGVLGMPGLTAYAGLFEVAAFRPGDAVFVSGAAGAVGSLVGQFARLRGASRVIGSAGSAGKLRFLTEELGFDAAFDYHEGPVREQLRRAAPDGIDVYFDNVGGEHLEAALDCLKLHGRAALCGAISLYNSTERPVGPANLALAIGKRLTLRGFLVSDHGHLRQEFRSAVADWVTSGQLVVRETVVDGLEQAVPAFIGMLRGANTGKMVVRLAADPHTDADTDMDADLAPDSE
ncbi:MAG: NADP-dependent oxidoreductase [Actinobacteria bacterium]|nr:NADP-dependent oxidoreductase [Actinomycetota bacterium]